MLWKRTLMIPAGYLAKQVETNPKWIKNTHVANIYSVSDCMSEPFTDYIGYWRHNGYSLFDDPNIIRQIAQETSIDITDMKFFYYEIYGEEFDEEDKKWKKPDSPDSPNVKEPSKKKLQGFDIVSFCVGLRGCSPLSCNNLADELPVNSHCLLPSLDKAKDALQSGLIKNCEPGPYRIFAVYTLPED